ncbi:pyruvate dehydrogenase complex E1 component subunit beta [Zymomonas mobilis]|uniref:Pyruvate dehydrogenase E1 component subunit beta n=1 Tax=Zymomonas mobilis subsp. pomaceae (strain ATCC 29192 / DSM 22645 / JCM 10191 / CCUG 17912 / NBRC 13757 / NCIMB 11200 / NRRL B-4491 / Barker I) TaxID=579138 RepID=F8EVQ9_ZYMMT|nr:pyruvate dehydrogenase complex E1 component subunit beta [Zymomonas mobilis]AEI38396.1 Transketolase central region [Zymomonas mobilis subsp. pomaceae ATCC 29192]MDX5948086.1 pyruvate dehydrogenase complex E1 component subunit beta [Zymomonas mobilis subsp. pomaceae]GEB89415.1 pyruvate dehydrogenase complex E1 component subunit beta [Zymomonas mobilis subsp. pomaceae]
MAIELKMPALSPTMEEGTLTKWLVKEGDAIKAGDILAEIETDKAIMEFEAVDEGILTKILVPEGSTDVKVGTPIAYLGQDAQDVHISASDKPSLASDTVSETTSVAIDKTVTLPSEQVEKQRTVGAEIPEGTQFFQQTLREALRDAMAEEMRRDDRVFVMGEEVAEYQGAYKVTQGLLDEFGPRRVVDTPISEYGFTGIGVGAAMEGLRPIIEFMTMNFSMQAIDHIINSAAKTHYMSGGQVRCPIVFRGPNGAAPRVGAQHTQNFGPWYAAVPGLIVLAPYDAIDAKGLLKAAIRSEDPVVFLECELLYGKSFDVPEIEDFVLPIGKARIIREGKDVTIVSYSIGVSFALEAAEKLAQEGINAEVIDLRTLRPLDKEAILKSLAKTNRMVTVEDGWPTCSISSEIAAIAMDEGFDNLDAPVLRVTNADTPTPYAVNLEKMALVSAEAVIKAVHKVCYRK